LETYHHTVWMTGALETDDDLGRPERGIVLTIAFWKSYEEANVDSQAWLVYKFMTATQKASKNPQYRRTRLSSTSCLISGLEKWIRTQLEEQGARKYARNNQRSALPHTLGSPPRHCWHVQPRYITLVSRKCAHSSLYIFDSCRSTLPGYL
jgi:hypothetical protein